MTNRNQITLRGAINTVATQVEPCEPWVFVPKVPAEMATSKTEFSRWRELPSTEHLVYTGYEGVNPNIRINSKTNPVRRLHALVMDFDALITDENCNTVLDRCSADLRPTWMSRSFSNGVRLVWMFEAPLPLEVGGLTKEFLKIAYSELKMGKLLAGPDQSAFHNVTTLYDVGRDWKKLGDYVLSTNVLNFWLTEAAKKTRWDKLGEISIPIDAVAEEVERQYPGRWEGLFEVGRRGVVFFDPNSTNPTSAIVTEAGMICFSQDQLFHPWRKIFGGPFIRKFQADKIGAAVVNVWYDGRKYWRKSPDGYWVQLSKDDFIAHLKVNHCINAAKAHGEVASEMDRTLVYVQEHRRVSGAAPRVYSETDLLEINGKKLINCAAVRVVLPAEEPQQWGENFPWLARFLESCWDDKSVACVEPDQPSANARDIFLAWFQRFYCSAWRGDLLKGHALFLVGPPNGGKTLLAARVIGDAMGGGSDASDFLQNQNSFNRELLEVGLWNVDDATATTDPAAHQKFSEMIKRTAANPFFSYHAKYRDAQRVEWNGRVCVTLNEDPSSLRIIPNMNSSLEDKIIVLKFADVLPIFPPKQELEGTITRELPYFLRWLTEWKCPSDLMGKNRFGFKAFIHEETRVAALHSSGVGDLIELVEIWLKRANPSEKHGDFWKGTASAWIAEVSTDDALRPLVSKFTARALGRKFSDAASIRDSLITRDQSSKYKGNGNRYVIHLRRNDHEVPEEKVVRYPARQLLESDAGEATSCAT